MAAVVVVQVGMSLGSVSSEPVSKIPQYSLFVPTKFCISVVSSFSGGPM